MGRRPSATVRAPVQEVVVTARTQTGTATGLIQQRRQSASLADGVSAQEVARAPDQTAGDAIRRVVGVSLVGNQYAYIRGLGGRYTSVLLNGVPLPSLDPDVPGVQLDLLPTALLNSLNVIKTFAPELPGDFAGGTLQLSTRDYPTSLSLQGSLSLGMDTLTHLNPALRYRGGGLDALGIEDGTRALPPSIPDRRLDPTTLGRPSVVTLGRDFLNRWSVSNGVALPNVVMNLSLGNTLRLRGRPLGYLLALSYQHTERLNVEEIATVNNQGTAQQPRYITGNRYPEQRNTTTNALLGFLGSVGYQPTPNHELSLLAMVNQNATDLVNFRQGYNVGIDAQVAERTLNFVQRSLLLTQLSGDHRELGRRHTRVRWTLYASGSERYAPDTRTMLYVDGPLGPAAQLDAGGTARLFQDLQQYELGGQGDVQSTFGPFTARLGVFARHSARSVQLRRFVYEDNRPDGRLQGLQGPEVYLDPSRFNEQFFLREGTLGNDSYEGSQSTAAPFLRGDLKVLGGRLRVMAGLRAEFFRQALTQGSPFAESGSTRTTTERLDVNPLPAASLTLALSERTALRAAYGSTVARPLLRELALMPYFDFLRGRDILGNPSLRSTVIHHGDLRWEWFPSDAEVLSVTAFYKHFRDPIEGYLDAANNNLELRNADAASVLGGEFEARFSLRRLWRPLDFVQFGANLTVAWSRVRATASEDRGGLLERPLVGQSPVLANLVLGLQRERFPLSAAVYYNYYGSRISDVGSVGVPSVLQDPLHQIDATVDWQATPHLALRLTGRNLAWQPVVLRAAEVTVQQQTPAASVSLRATWTY